jgi:hypothetical protein
MTRWYIRIIICLSSTTVIHSTQTIAKVTITVIILIPIGLISMVLTYSITINRLSIKLKVIWLFKHFQLIQLLDSNTSLIEIIVIVVSIIVVTDW